MPQELTQFGIAGLTLGILFFIVRFFVSSMKGKDEHIFRITADFTKVVKNHLEHADERQKESNQIFQKMQVTLDGLPERTIELAGSIYPPPKKKARKKFRA